ncbi:MAG: DNA repair protein RadA [Candidatus Melainabacteria bacterium]|nr:DNA repair protein RadA [Candidatus Melainabacteria bacterium]
MSRTRSRWVCQQCGFQSGRYLGRCTDCGNWNCLVEEMVADDRQSLDGGEKGLASLGPCLLESVCLGDKQVISTGLPGFDEVLGGGLVPGSVILLAGDPGVGKSTLLLQVSHLVGQTCKVLYVSGEESVQQLKLRAKRLGIDMSGILVDAEQNVTLIEKHIADADVQLVIVDSIQCLYHPNLTSAAGSVSQVRECAAVLIGSAKSAGIATIVVGHVTKDGSIAGPRVLEHMVDVVLQVEGERLRQVRILRAAKNRFGSTQELGVFTMTQRGLVEVDNPSALFLGDRLSRLNLKQAPSGTAIIAGGEGTKTLLLEVQALVGTSPFANPRRVVNGWDLNRLWQVLAVLEKKVGLSLCRHDVYVNIVGGFEFSDPAGDLGISVAVATSLLDRSIDPGLVFIGEIGLTGEVRPVLAIEQRLKEAGRMGFSRALVPASNLPLAEEVGQLNVEGVQFLVEALTKAMPGQVFAEKMRSSAALVPSWVSVDPS